MEYYFLIVVFAVLFDFSSSACGARHFAPNVEPGNHGGDEKFEEKQRALRNLDASNHHRRSIDTLTRSQKEETNYLKPMPILEYDKESIMIEGEHVMTWCKRRKTLSLKRRGASTADAT